jgi:hypothetical protein
VVYMLLTGRQPNHTGAAPASRLRRNLPAGLNELLGELLSGDPAQQPSASVVAEKLEAWARERFAGRGLRVSLAGHQV